MIHEQTINVTAMKTVEEELNLAIQQASGSFESYLADRSMTKYLEDCLSHSEQIRGVLKLLQLQGAYELSVEMSNTLHYLCDMQNKQHEFTLLALSHAFIALPCYIEFSISDQKAVPILIAPFIAELQSAQQKEITPESAFADFSCDLSAVPDHLTSLNDENDTISRLRHMYQIGLLAILKGDMKEAQLTLMHRALTRLSQFEANTQLKEICWLASMVVGAILSGKLSVVFTRKRLLASLDGIIRAEAKSMSVDESKIAAAKHELLFLLALVGQDYPDAKEALSLYQVSESAKSDMALSRLRDIMQGPNAKTIESMVAAIKDELQGAKEILEIASQDIGALTVDLQPLANVLLQVSDILNLVGLKSPARILNEQKSHVEAWISDSETMTSPALLDVADALLYVESSLAGLHRLELNDAAIDEASEMTKKALIARSHLAEAESLVINEAQAGISLAKRAINSYIESDYDKVHISNIAVTLNTVKGGLLVLKLHRAAGVLEAAMSFVNDKLKVAGKDDGLDSLLETLADALIAVEYYLEEVETHKDADESVLKVAEDSLASLGFPVVA